MNQTQQNLVRLAAACRGDKKAFAAVCRTAQALNLPSPKRKPSAAAARLQNFVRAHVAPLDLQSAIAKFGMTAVHNKVSTDSILETAAQKFAEQAMKKAGGK
jgi:hypothetical protein